MSDPQAKRWCPHCRQATSCAPLPQLVGDDQLLVQLGLPGQALAFRRKLYCLSCTSIFDAVELPAELVRQLVDASRRLEDTRRQLSWHKLLAAKQATEPAVPDAPQLRQAG